MCYCVRLIRKKKPASMYINNTTVSGILECTTLKSVHHFTTILRLKMSIHAVFGLDKMVFIIELFYIRFYLLNN